jgi:hypothetical protein
MRIRPHLPRVKRFRGQWATVKAYDIFLRPTDPASVMQASMSQSSCRFPSPRR